MDETSGGESGRAKENLHTKMVDVGRVNKSESFVGRSTMLTVSREEDGGRKTPSGKTHGQAPHMPKLTQHPRRIRDENINQASLPHSTLESG